MSASDSILRQLVVDLTKELASKHRDNVSLRHELEVMRENAVQTHSELHSCAADLLEEMDMWKSRAMLTAAREQEQRMSLHRLSSVVNDVLANTATAEDPRQTDTLQRTHQNHNNLYRISELLLDAERINRRSLEFGSEQVFSFVAALHELAIHDCRQTHTMASMQSSFQQVANELAGIHQKSVSVTRHERRFEEIAFGVFNDAEVQCRLAREEVMLSSLREIHSSFRWWHEAKHEAAALQIERDALIYTAFEVEVTCASLKRRVDTASDQHRMAALRTQLKELDDDIRAVEEEKELLVNEALHGKAHAANLHLAVKQQAIDFAMLQQRAEEDSRLVESSAKALNESIAEQSADVQQLILRTTSFEEMYREAVQQLASKSSECCRQTEEVQILQQLLVQHEQHAHEESESLRGAHELLEQSLRTQRLEIERLLACDAELRQKLGEAEVALLEWSRKESVCQDSSRLRKALVDTESNNVTLASAPQQYREEVSELEAVEQLAASQYSSQASASVLGSVDLL